jgi:uncharacterized protein (DUF1499 family)
MRRAMLAAAAASLLGGCMGLFAGTAPTLGATGGKLAPCPASPNCVSSQADRANDAAHYVAPFASGGAPEAAWAALREIVRTAERARVVSEQPGYLRAEFASRVLGFVDDVEFLLDPAARTIHVRSSSRLGYRDFGVNRERIEALRAKLAAAVK